MRILLRITVRMMHSMHDCVGAGIQVRRALGHPGEKMEKALPPFFHRKHFMSAVAVMEKRLEKQRNVPVKN